MFNLAKSLIIACAMLSIVCCGAQSSNLHHSVSGNALVEQCLDPVEVHNVPPVRFPIPAQVSRHHNCMGVVDLLAITWPGKQTAVNLATVELLSLMYVEYENRDKTNAHLQLKHIKVDRFDTGPDQIGIVNVVFYELIEVPLEKSE